MKTTWIISLLSFMSLAALSQGSQERIRMSKALQNIGYPTETSSDFHDSRQTAVKTQNNFTKSGTSIFETVVGETKYDNQSNASIQNRMYVYPDGTMAGVWTMGKLEAGGWTGRGTGYNYFDGNNWGTLPTNRLETTYRTGWPSYAPLGNSGEIVVSHISDVNYPLGGLVVLTRPMKGTGTWSQTLRQGPTGHEDILWARMVTNGNSIHIMALTEPSANGGTLYNGLDGAILYYRSQNGGVTWDKEHIQPTGLTSNNYFGFKGDNYAWAEPKGDTLAFVVANAWYDMCLLKSTDNGDTWTRTVIWKHPYPKFNYQYPTYRTDTFYCPDGASNVALDNNGKAHVFFGVNRAVSADDGAGGSSTFWFPYMDGIAYWNEDDSLWSTDTNTVGWQNLLDPDSLDVSGHLVAWMQDLNNNGTLDLVAPIGYDLSVGWYGLSLSSMPSASIDDNDDIFLVYASVNELRYTSDPGKNFRHVFGRGFIQGQWRTITHLTSSLVHNYSECVFPCIAPNTDINNVNLLFQSDDEPGMYMRPDDDHQANITTNLLIVSTATKSEFYSLINVEDEDNIIDVSQNFPNPFSSSTVVSVSLNNASTLSLRVFDMCGRMVSSQNRANVGAGIHNFSIDADDLKSGIYFYTITSGKSATTRKMIIR